MKTFLKYLFLVVITLSCMAVSSLILGESIGYNTVGVKGLVAGVGLYVLNKKKQIFKLFDCMLAKIKTMIRQCDKEFKENNSSPKYKDERNENIKAGHSPHFSSSSARAWISPYFEKVMSKYCKGDALNSKIRLFFYTDDRPFSVVDMKDSPLVIASKVIKEILRLLDSPSSITEQQSRVSLNSLCNNVIESGKLTEKKSRIDWGLIGFLSLLAILLVYIMWDMGEDAKGSVSSEPKQTPSVEQIISSNSSMDYNKHRLLYDVLKKDNYDLGSYESFHLNLWDETRRMNLYKALLKDNYELGSYKEFSGNLGFPLPEGFEGDVSCLPVEEIEFKGKEYKVLSSRSPDFMYRYPGAKIQSASLGNGFSTYTLEGKRYNIPDDVVADFEKDMPEATQRYKVGEDFYNVPVSRRQAFLKKYPNAELSDDPKPVNSKTKAQNSSRSDYKEVLYNTGDMPYISHFGWGDHDEESLSKLTIINHSSKDAVVLLENSRLRVVRNVFVKNGTRYVMDKIPEGMYSVKIMYGNSWNKDKDNGPSFPKGGFMKNVSFEKTEESDMFDYTFKRDAEGVSYPSYSVTLHKVQNGNLESESISASDFFY